MQPIRLIAGFLTVGLWTMASRVLGFVRDAMILAYLGTGPVYEAYVVAFRLPNMFRRFFAEGAFNVAFVPMFAKRLEAGENPPLEIGERVEVARPHFQLQHVGAGEHLGGTICLLHRDRAVGAE